MGLAEAGGKAVAPDFLIILFESAAVIVPEIIDKIDHDSQKGRSVKGEKRYVRVEGSKKKMRYLSDSLRHTSCTLLLSA